MKRSIYVSVTLLCLLVFHPLFAQDTAPEQVVDEKLEDLLVQEKKPGNSIAGQSFSAMELKELGHNVKIITGEELEAAGFVDLSKALAAFVPGLYSATGQGRGGYTNTRVHGSNQILWLLDGVKVGAIHGSWGMNWNYTLSVHMIERIEILEGGESLFYGTGARGGVINIVTKGITDEASGQFGSSFGTDNYREAYGHVTETINGHGLMAFGSLEEYEGYHVADDKAYADFGNTYGNKNIGYDRGTVGVKYRKEFDLAGNSVLNAQYRRHTGYFDYPNPNQRESMFEWNQDISSLTWDHDVNKNFSYNLTTYLHRWWADLTQQQISGAYMRNHEPVECDDLGVNFKTSTRWGQGHEIVSGIDYRNYWGSFRWFYGHDFDRVQEYAGFASYRPYLFFAPETKFAFSGRYTLTSDDASSFVWNASLKTPIVGPTYFKGSVGTGFSLPKLGQLSGDVVGIGSRTIGNPNLEPEESFDIQGGVGGEWQYFNCYAGYFYNEVDNLIQSVVIDAATSTSTYKNVAGKTKIKGVELSAGIGPFYNVSLDVGATWTDAEDGDTGEQLEQIPEFNGTINLKYRYDTDRFGADLMTQYTGNIYERGLGTTDDLNYGEYFVTDASAFVSFGQGRKHRMTLRVENIFDEDYANGYSVASNIVYKKYGMSRSFVLGYTYTF